MSFIGESSLGARRDFSQVRLEMTESSTLQQPWKKGLTRAPHWI
jgi:hypothetical protein